MLQDLDVPESLVLPKYNTEKQWRNSPFFYKLSRFMYYGMIFTPLLALFFSVASERDEGDREQSTELQTRLTQAIFYGNKNTHTHIKTNTKLHRIANVLVLENKSTWCFLCNMRVRHLAVAGKCVHDSQLSKQRSAYTKPSERTTAKILAISVLIHGAVRGVLFSRYRVYLSRESIFWRKAFPGGVRRRIDLERHQLADTLGSI